MSITVLECLQNAKINFENLGRVGINNHPFYVIAMDQLENAIEALENDRGADFVLQDHLFGKIKR